jgi:hypothetical protein
MSGVKLLDFGLARVTPAAVAASGLSMAPTGVTPVTAQGTILGGAEVFSRWVLDRLRFARIRPRRNLCSSVSRPRWQVADFNRRRDGSRVESQRPELFNRNGAKMMAVEIDTVPTLSPANRSSYSRVRTSRT